MDHRTTGAGCINNKGRRGEERDILTPRKEEEGGGRCGHNFDQGITVIGISTEGRKDGGYDRSQCLPSYKDVRGGEEEEEE